MAPANINTEQLIEYVKEELTDLRAENIISPATYNRKSNVRLIIGAINQADRDICLYEKYEDNVAIYVPSGRTTLYLKDQKIQIKEFIDAHDSIISTDPLQYNYLINDKGFLDIISVASTKGYVFDSLPLKGEKTSHTIEYGTFTDLNIAREEAQEDGGRDGRFKTYFTVNPNKRKIMISQPFESPKWILFKAKIAPQELDVMEPDLDELKEYEILSPYYCKAWLTIKVLTELLPRTTAMEAGLVEDEALQQRRTRGLKPGTGNVVISGDEIEAAYTDEFDEL